MELTLDNICIYKELKKFFQSVPAKRLEVVIAQMTRLHEEKLKEEEEWLKENQERQKKLDQIRQLMSGGSISVEEVLTGVITPKKQKLIKPRVHAAPKFRWKDSEGKRHEWSGRGVMPVSLDALLKQGAKLEDFRIKKST